MSAAPRIAAERIPPHDLAAEAALLGAMLLSTDAIGAATDTLGAEAYYRPAHAHIHAAIVGLYARGEPADPATVADELHRNGLLDQLEDGRSELLNLQSSTPAISNAACYARIVADHHRLRRLITTAGEIAELGYSLPTEVDEAVDRAESLLFGLTDAGRRRRLQTMEEALHDWLNVLERRFEGTEPPGVQTGFVDLDRMLLGLHPGQLVTIAGRPAMGKTVFACQTAANAAVSGHAVLFVSLEMTHQEVTERLVSAASRVGLQRIRSGKIADKDWPLITDAVGRIGDWPIIVDDDSGATLLSIRGAARRAAQKLGRLDVVIVDYLQLLNTTGRAENRQVEIAELSRGLKRLAGELGIPIVTLAQLNREVEKRADKRPMLSDLRESGAVEQDSDVVVFLYRDDYYNAKSNDAGILEAIVAKQRNGPTGTARLAYHADHGRIANLVRAV